MVHNDCCFHMLSAMILDNKPKIQIEFMRVRVSSDNVVKNYKAQTVQNI